MSADTAAERPLPVGLRFSSDREPGIRRIRRGKGFSFALPDGTPVTDAGTRARIRSLAIPPAYREVWICPDASGHLQATGLDARGRKQYRYHPQFREVRDANKFERMAAFGRSLPQIRERLERDLGAPVTSRERVLATVVSLLERSLIRVGSAEYARDNESFGLTTLRNDQVEVSGSRIRFHFRGKSGIEHDVTVAERRLAKVVRRMQDLAGEELFGYEDADGKVHDVTSAEVNAYLDSLVEGHFTAKDFRTWAGTVLCLSELATVGGDSPQKQAVTAATKRVAAQLGNTPAVCRKSYIHPVVVRTYLEGKLEPPGEGLDRAEAAVLALLEAETKAARPRRRRRS